MATSITTPEALPKAADASTRSAGRASGAEPVAARIASPQEVHRWLKAGEAVLVDVREPDEHVRERIAGAHSLPLSKFEAKAAGAHLAGGKRVVLHCRSGRRSEDALRLAEAGGLAGAALIGMDGGLEAWKQAGLPVVVDTSVSRISVMRQVQMVVGFAVLIGAALAWFVHPAFLIIPAFFGAGLAFAGLSGTCALATVLGWMPWNRSGGGSCSSGRC